MFGLQGVVKSMQEERSESGSRRYPLEHCTFDEKGRATECSHYDSEKHGVLLSRISYYYDDLGRPAGTDSYSIYGGWEHPEKFAIRYDDHGRLLETRGTQSDGKPGTRVTYKYDRAGNLVEQAWYSWLDQSQPAGITTSKYDEKDRLVDSEYIDDHQANYRYHVRAQNEYNDAGQITKMEALFVQYVPGNTRAIRDDDRLHL